MVHGRGFVERSAIPKYQDEIFLEFSNGRVVLFSLLFDGAKVHGSLNLSEIFIFDVRDLLYNRRSKEPILIKSGEVPQNGLGDFRYVLDVNLGP
jgi:hypothetical protein